MSENMKQYAYWRDQLEFLVPFIIIAIIWELLVLVGFLNHLLFPPPSIIFNTFIDLLLNRYPSLIDHLITSLYHIIVGYVLGVSLGIIVGTLIGINRVLYYALNPIIALLIPVPTLAWVPLLLIIVGLGHETIIIAIFLGCFFPVVYNTLTGIRSTEHHLIWAAEVMGATKLDIYLHVLLPSSLLSIITGSRLAVGYSWRALVGAEMLAGIAMGVGHMIYAARWGFHIDVMFTGLVIIAAGGLIMDRLLMRPLERMTIEKWGIVQRRSGK
ncbi:MAG: ABC transporter permease [Candidatus Hodarchaeota archaeon]